MFRAVAFVNRAVAFVESAGSFVKLTVAFVDRAVAFVERAVDFVNIAVARVYLAVVVVFSDDAFVEKRSAGILACEYFLSQKQARMPAFQRCLRFGIDFYYEDSINLSIFYNVADDVRTENADRNGRFEQPR